MAIKENGFCDQCGASLEAGAEFCDMCGAKVATEAEPNPPAPPRPVPPPSPAPPRPVPPPSPAPPRPIPPPRPVPSRPLPPPPAPPRPVPSRPAQMAPARVEKAPSSPRSKVIIVVIVLGLVAICGLLAIALGYYGYFSFFPSQATPTATDSPAPSPSETVTDLPPIPATQIVPENTAFPTPAASDTPPATATDTPVAPTVTTQPVVEEEFFAVKSLGVVKNGATTPNKFTIQEAWLVNMITTYHWNNGRGTLLVGTIGLKAQDGQLFGPWQAIGGPGQGGLPNAYWVVKPGIVIPAGTYTLLDSDPATWSQNNETGGKGMGWGKGIRQK